MARQREKKTASTAWLERYNPLNGLSIAQAKQIFDAARSGDTQRLHWLYQEIETQNPVLSMCVTRRSGAAAGFNWSVAERASKNGSLSQEQKDAAETFLANIENLSDLFEHLDLALFRGFAHAQPIWEGDAVHHIELLDSWKFLKKDGAWLYNPVCDGFSSNCVSCENARLVTVERRRPVDVPALALHIRAAVGERDWGRFLERYALPKPAITMAPNATKDDREEYLTSGEGLENGQVSVWPNGTSITDFAGGSRGVDPFSVFITHQEKTILMLATGGTLGSMAESGAGTLAGNAQQDVWESIVSRDSGIIAAAVQRSLLRPFLAAKFPGQPVCVDFVFDLTQKPTPKEIFETAAAARNAGYLVDQAELEEATGFTLRPDSPESRPSLGGFSPNKKEPGKSLAKGRPVGLSQIAASILDGSVSFEEGLKRAQTELDAATLESLSGNLQEALEDAMYLAALESIDRSGSTSLPNECIWLVNEFDEAEHPRDNDGKFSTSGSSDRGGEAPSSQQKLSRQEECKALLAKYKASTDHPSVDDVVSGKVPIRQALEKGFEATFGGQKVVFFTGFLSKKYENALDPGRLSLIRHALERRSRMFPVKHHGNQIGLVEQLTRSNSDNRFVITADRDTSLAVNVMKCNNAYIKREYK